nr:plastocyanin/azurin family copper-binding protein [uncultured Rhodoferax sp.]
MMNTIPHLAALHGRVRMLSMVLWLGLMTPAAWAEEHVIRMLNAGGDESMVFEPAFVQAQPGDTVRFEPVNSGHFVRSLAVPADASPWLSAVDQVFVLRLDHEGLYFYNCPPHLMMGMVGLIQVGQARNKSAATEVMKATKGRIYSGSARIDALLAQIR